MNPCVTCTNDNKKNNHRLNPLLCPITYECANTIVNFSLPRKYTNIHNDNTQEVLISVGKNYNSIMLASPEAVNLETQITGKWCKKNEKYIIVLDAIVSSTKNPVAAIRNTIICKEFDLVLEAIALAETALLKLHPKLGNTKIYIKFHSIDKKYDRVEYWGKLKKWQ